MYVRGGSRGEREREGMVHTFIEVKIIIPLFTN
jgi:hypothetical protein